MKKRYSEEQIIGFLREADAGLLVKELCRKHGVSALTCRRLDVDRECPHTQLKCAYCTFSGVEIAGCEKTIETLHIAQRRLRPDQMRYPGSSISLPS